MYGFIILRHVNSFSSNCFWKESYNCIRLLYPTTQIVIIDDNSDLSHLDNDGVELSNCIIINSEYIGRGEILPYYYFYKYKWFDRAIIIHDSVFIKKYIDFDRIEGHVNFLWDFTHHWDNEELEINYINHLTNNEELIDFYKNKNNWLGCYGVMSIINHDLLNLIQTKYNFFNLLDVIKTRHDRMCLERIFSVICNQLDNRLQNNSSIFGDIHYYINLNFSFIDYMNLFYLTDDVDNNPYNNRHFIKIRTGR
jgi:hypothetical protein